MIVVANIMKYNIKDISWKLYCEILYSIFKDKELKVKIILKYMSEIFLFIINNTKVVTEDIIKLRNYKEIFEVGMRFELEACGRHQENKNRLYGYLWL